MTKVTELGLLRTRLDERLAQLQADYKAVYGEDIKVDAADVDGEFLGILAERISDIDQLVEDVYNSFNPQLATGVALARLVQLNGIRKQAGSFSTVDLTLGGTANTVVPAGSLVKNPADNSAWTTTTVATIGAGGTVLVTARRTEKDSTTAAAGTITKIDTPVFGWQTVTNVNPATPGSLEEKDSLLRIRRRASTSTPGQSILDAVYGAIANLTGVRLVEVYENDQDVTDANGQVAHSIYAIVEGGVVADIAQVIWNKKTAGTTTVGGVSTVIKDVQGRDHTIKFARPAYTDVHVKVTVTKYAGFPADGAAQIKNALVEWALSGATGDAKTGLQIGEDVVQTRLYDPVNKVPNHSINSIQIGLAPNPTGTANIVIPFDGLARFDVTRITVVEL